MKMNPQELIVPLWINGKEEFAESTIEVISPLTDTICWKASSASTKDAIRAVEAAQAAFPSWSKTKPALRQKILLKAADILEERTSEYGDFMGTEMGAEKGTSHYWVLPLGIKFLRDLAGRVVTLCGTVPVCEAEGTSGMLWKEPYGAVLGICPW